MVKRHVFGCTVVSLKNGQKSFQIVEVIASWKYGAIMCPVIVIAPYFQMTTTSTICKLFWPSLRSVQLNCSALIFFQIGTPPGLRVTRWALFFLFQAQLFGHQALKIPNFANLSGSYPIINQDLLTFDPGKKGHNPSITLAPFWSLWWKIQPILNKEEEEGMLC